MSMAVHFKSIFIAENRKAYREEMALIEHDIDLELSEIDSIDKIKALDIRAIMAIMLSNRFIWENESRAREGSDDQDKLLKLTHSVNGSRNTAKNVLSKRLGQRVDLKIDCLAANLPPQYGNWKLFEEGEV